MPLHLMHAWTWPGAVEYRLMALWTNQGIYTDEANDSGAVLSDEGYGSEQSKKIKGVFVCVDSVHIVLGGISHPLF